MKEILFMITVDIFLDEKNIFLDGKNRNEQKNFRKKTKKVGDCKNMKKFLMSMKLKRIFWIRNFENKWTITINLNNDFRS